MLYDMINEQRTVKEGNYSLSETLYVMKNRKNDAGVPTYAFLIAYLTIFWTTKSKY